MTTQISFGSNFVVSSDIKLSVPDQIFGRVYYVLCTATDLLQTIAKVCVGIFSTLFATLCFGQSTVLNRVTAYFWKDSWFSTKMLFQSIRGIADPAGAYKAKASMHINNELDFHATPINFIVNCTSRLIFAANMVKEIATAGLALVRFIAATSMCALSLGYADGMSVVAVSSCFSMNRAITMAGISFAGIFTPSNVFGGMRNAHIS